MNIFAKGTLQMYSDDWEYTEDTPSFCICEPAMERLIRFPIYYNAAFRKMILSTQAPLFNDTNQQDPTEWLKDILNNNNRTTKLYSPVDCNHLYNLNANYFWLANDWNATYPLNNKAS